MNSILPLVLPAATAAILAFVLTPLVARLAVRIGAMDVPNERKMHRAPMPRLGGLAVVTAIALVWAGSRWWQHGTWVLAPQLPAGVGFGVLPILVVSIVDDIRQVQVKTKFICHLAGALVAVACGVSLRGDVHLVGQQIHLGLLALPLSALWLVGVTNAFNIIDGLDGLATGLALIAATSMAAVFAMVGQPAMAAAALVLAGGLAGFLPYNVHPAKLFLGDSGATAVGFTLAAFALKGGATLSSGFAALVPVFMMGLPIAETLISMARRFVSRAEHPSGGVFVADRNHIHHRLLALGIGHGTAVLILYAVGLVLAGAAFVSIFLKVHEAALFVVALILAGFLGMKRLGYDEFAFIRRGTVLKVYEAPVMNRSMFVVFADVGIAVLSAYLAVGLKDDTWAFGTIPPAAFDLAGTFAPLTVLVFWKTGMYRGTWRLAGVHDLFRACSSSLLITAIGLVSHTVVSPSNLSWTTFLIYGFVNMTLVAGSRASYVVLRNSQRLASTQGTPVLIYGAGMRGLAAVDELFEHPGSGLRPIGFVDDDLRTHGKQVAGLPVLGGGAELERILHSSGARALLVATAAVTADKVEGTTEICERYGIAVYRMGMQFECLVDDVDQRLDAVATVSTHVTPASAAVSAAAGAQSMAAVIDAQICRACGSQKAFRSHCRGVSERLRKLRTMKRLYRCHNCGWRGWLLPLVACDSESCLAISASPDLTALDGPLGSPSVPRARYASQS